MVFHMHVDYCVSQEISFFLCHSTDSPFVDQVTWKLLDKKMVKNT